MSFNYLKSECGKKIFGENLNHDFLNNEFLISLFLPYINYHKWFTLERKVSKTRYRKFELIWKVMIVNYAGKGCTHRGQGCTGTVSWMGWIFNRCFLLSSRRKSRFWSLSVQCTKLNISLIRFSITSRYSMTLFMVTLVSLPKSCKMAELSHSIE